MPERAKRPFLILTVAFFTLLLGSNLPTPLYAVYRALRCPMTSGGPASGATLSLRAAVTIFAVVVGATALTAIAWQVGARIRPASAVR